MTTQSHANHFELFALPVGFDVNPSELSERYLQLQTECHPDRYATATAQERVAAVQLAARVNEAHQVLKSPLKRAFYLLALRGIEVDNEQQTTADTAFLMQQLELREQLEEVPNAADPLEAIDALAAEVRAQEKALLDAFNVDYLAQDNEKALETLKKLQFFGRLNSQLDDTQARIEDDLLG